MDNFYKRRNSIRKTCKRWHTIKKYRYYSSTWNYDEVIDFEKNKTFTLKRLNGDYFVKYTCTPIDNGTEFEYLEWVANGD